jgi:hypothetical protein
MVRAVLVVSRDPEASNDLASYANLLNRNLAADEIEPRPPTVVERTGLTAAVLNPSGAAHVQGASLAIGTLLEPTGAWHVPRAQLPDGSYALLRADDAYVELAADGVASRTLWYALTDRQLIASTSQRAIVALLGSFEPNRAVLPWMLSSGTLGPSGGWDARLRRVQPGERVLLDRARWRLQSSVESTQLVAEPALSHDAHLERLRSTVVDACRRWSFDARKWLLTLSGGVDSRGLLCLLRDRGMQTITWGLAHSDEKDGNDAHVAREVARSLGATHRFIALEPAELDPEIVVRRFLALGEGRVDRISGYVDGFRVWKTLFDEGCTGVIRGDHAFGSSSVDSAYAVRSKTSLTTLSDYFAANEIEAFELPDQRLPEALLRTGDETMAAWRDRLFRSSRIPAFLAALTDLKTAHVDVANPLLARSVLDCVRALPDELRTDKSLWRELVRRQLPEVPLARRVAIPSAADFLTQRRVLQLLLDEVNSARAGTMFTATLRARCRAALLAALQTKRPVRRIDWGESPLARAVPAPLRAAIRRLRPDRPSLAPVVLAFRMFVASRMQAMLAADAATRTPAAALRAWGSR